MGIILASWEKCATLNEKLHSPAIILFRNDYAISIWLLVILVEVADLIYRRVRRATLSKEGRMHAEADV